ncbi:hypothetical protein [uncultured Paludibaculum sp.]|uniref:hypothetical protein n=1 Tax=uncultured Paludibaculum sp. TaxID=1765020 RepID=UPI002AAA6915|nr:hypothetical protein [uncultured Paludibaculum sp.]
MRTIPVRQDDVEYVKLLKSDGINRYKELKDSDLKTAPAGAYILTGMKTNKFGGGMSPDGFLMNGRVLLGRLRIEGRVSHGGITVE